MNQKQTIQIEISAQDILEEAKSHYKPRIKLLEMLKTKAEEVSRIEQSKSALVPDIDDNVKKLVMLTISSPFLSTSGYYSLLICIQRFLR